MIGNLLEWYDFAIYGYFAAQIGRQFFPHEDGVTQAAGPDGRLARIRRPSLAGILLGSAVGAAFAAQQYMFLNIFSVHLSISRQFKGAIVAAVTY
jgi:MFS transporter, MHS family, proline/betaine transporter